MEPGLFLPIAQSLAWTFVHAVWQGILVASLYLLGCRLLKQNSHRYLLGMICLGLFLLLQVCTVIYCRQWNAGTGIDLPLTLTTDAASPTRDARMLNDSGTFQPISLPEPSWLLTTARRLDPLVFWVGVVWLVGVWLFMVRFAIASWLLRKELDRCIPVAQAKAVSLRQLQSRIAPRHPVRFLESNESSVPATCGWIQPVVLLPNRRLLKLRGRYLDAIVLHELAHIARRDSLTTHLRAMVHSIYFFHPLLRWMERRMTDDSEKAADDLAARALGDPKLYARALIELEEKRAGLLKLGASGGSLKDRLLNVIAVREAERRNTSKLSLMMLALCGMLLLMTASEVIVRGASPEQKLLAWVEERDLRQAVLETLRVDTSVDRASPALAEAVEQLQRDGELDEAMLSRLADALLSGVPGDLMIRHWYGQPYQRLSLSAQKLPRYGDIQQRGAIAQQLLAQASVETDAKEQAKFARAFVVLSIIDVSSVHSRVFSWMLDPVNRPLLHLDQQTWTQLDFAISLEDRRRVAAAPLLRGAHEAADDALAEAIHAASFLPVAQMNFSATATTQDWARLRDAIRDAPIAVRSRWEKIYPNLIEP